MYQVSHEILDRGILVFLESIWYEKAGHKKLGMNHEAILHSHMNRGVEAKSQ